MPRIFITLILLLGFAATAQAQVACPCGGGTRMDATQINSTLNGNTVCAILGAERWQEWHNGSAIFELGNNPPGGENVGTWSVAGTDANDSTVTYNYGSGGSYPYSMCVEGATPPFSYHFCGAKIITNATVQPGQGGCGP